MDQDLAVRVPIEEVADGADARPRQGGAAHPVVQVLHPQRPDALPLGRGAQRLLGLAVMPQVDDPDVTLPLQRLQVGLVGWSPIARFGVMGLRFIVRLRARCAVGAPPVHAPPPG
jgi:hypothetical protein